MARAVRGGFNVNPPRPLRQFGLRYRWASAGYVIAIISAGRTCDRDVASRPDPGGVPSPDVGLRTKAAKISPERDPKLRVLVAELKKIAAQAKEEATDAIDEAQRRKVLLFSFFADTVKYVREHAA
jgi:hypothetical protein